LTNDERLGILNYVSYVQTTEPHFIEPYDIDGYTPMYVTISSVGDLSKRSENGFFWDWASTSWREAL
jgi:hypothetical protein